MSSNLPDSGILQYVPKGAYYEGTDEQFVRVSEMWNGLLAYDRVLFALLSILNGSGFSKGMISHLLLSNPIDQGTGKELIPVGLDDDFEKNVIMYNLHKIASEQSMPRALKNLLILAGSESGAKRVNNSRTRKIILEFIFNRDNRELDALAVNYKAKLAKLVKHALGKQDLFKILSNDESNEKLFQKLIGRYNRNAYPVVHFLFGKKPSLSKAIPYFPMIENYVVLKNAAVAGDLDEFRKHMKKLPWRTVIGFRNTYKLNIDKAEVMGTTKMSEKDKLQTQTAQKRAGVKQVRKVNYEKQDVYDLWKLFYHKLLNNDPEEVDKITAAIDTIVDKSEKLDFGDDVAIVLDFSHSMRGSDQRKLHPVLTGLSLLSSISFKTFHHVGGRQVKIEGSDFGGTVPSGASPLWKGLVDAVAAGAKTIIVISDGYENAIKGMFDHVYKHFKAAGQDFEFLHINPVFAADAKSGTTRSLVEGVEPIPVNDHKHLETEFIFKRMIENTEMVKNLLVARYQKLIGR
ncbi:hypothetical protein KAR91_07865 [Candidatus Pacearchaeota archaeon]|nr:hypothetical protein [Candidatus Pacearchaeota archaeon]